MKVTGTLEGWRKDPLFNIVWGYINGDIHNRFVDGTLIHTSDITPKGQLLEEGRIISTRNSFYKLGKPAI